MSRGLVDALARGLDQARLAAGEGLEAGGHHVQVTASDSTVYRSAHDARDQPPRRRQQEHEAHEVSEHARSHQEGTAGDHQHAVDDALVGGAQLCQRARPGPPHPQPLTLGEPRPEHARADG